ncbi:MAG: hypothetical protein ACTSR0_04200 [Candidatus Asgardarchaeia archaeon]
MEKNVWIIKRSEAMEKIAKIQEFLESGGIVMNYENLFRAGKDTWTRISKDGREFRVVVSRNSYLVGITSDVYFYKEIEKALKWL